MTDKATIIVRYEAADGMTHGDPAAPDHTIIRTEVGSRAHGLATPESDRDVMGVYVESPEQVMGLAPRHEHFIRRDKPEGVRSEAGDTDLTLYSLRKYLQLATDGNPTVLVLLFAQPEAITPHGQQLLGLAPHIVSAQAGRRFLGYLDGQRERMTGGGKRNRVPSRPELVERHGYDTKYAGHALRLGLQGVELMTTGRLTLPMLGDELEACRAVRAGEVTFEDALGMVGMVRADLVAAIDATDLPPQPDRAMVSRAMIAMQLDYWREADEAYQAEQAEMRARITEALEAVRGMR